MDASDSALAWKKLARAGLVVLLAIGLTLTDLVLKRIVESTLGDGRTIAGPLIDFRLTYNSGVAFGFGAALPIWIVTFVTGLIIVVGAVSLFKHAERLNHVALMGGSLLLGGALGNFVDRLDGKGVVDYFHTGWFATFNLADVFVTFGVVLLVAGLWWGEANRSNFTSSSLDGVG